MALTKTTDKVQVMYGDGPPPLADMVTGGIAIDFTGNVMNVKKGASKTIAFNGCDFTIINSNTTVTNNSILAVDTRNNDVTLTIQDGVDAFTFFDAYGTFDKHNVIIDPVNKSVMTGTSGELIVTSVKNASRSYKIVNDNWRII